MVKLIEAICRKFLWTGSTEMTKKALLAWDRVCYPKSAGGLNILDISTWNKATIAKLLWNICNKKGKLWVKWIHSYYGGMRNLLEDIPKQAAWSTQKILQATKYFSRAGYAITDIQVKSHFSTKDFYNKLRGQYQKVSWRKLTCNNMGLPSIYMEDVAAMVEHQQRSYAME
ncbi:hypothetical protein MTR67_025601 [Solanum verrucosum]|uniref:Uncharacterized protein n=1 Tax=Solanum verrucosum TaxID=315347 RepID=A0AAF0R5E8_SOLVR|nr:hypothetical protein MTR67_025601 [Solanum verrucosum]